MADREAALRLATSRDVDRKLRTVVSSRFFWVYALSLWDPDAFWKCITGASAFAFVGLCLATAAPPGGVLPPAQLTAAVIFEYFIFGLILMWVFSLGPWLNPRNLLVIFTFIFRLYRKNVTTADLSAEDIGRLFPEDDPEYDERSIFPRIYHRVMHSPVLGSLILGSLLAVLTVAPLLVASRGIAVVHLPLSSPFIDVIVAIVILAIVGFVTVPRRRQLGTPR